MSTATPFFTFCHECPLVLFERARSCPQIDDISIIAKYVQELEGRHHDVELFGVRVFVFKVSNYGTQAIRSINRKRGLINVFHHLAHLVSPASPKVREFWLGYQGAAEHPKAMPGSGRLVPVSVMDDALTFCHRQYHNRHPDRRRLSLRCHSISNKILQTLQPYVILASFGMIEAHRQQPDFSRQHRLLTGESYGSYHGYLKPS